MQTLSRSVYQQMTDRQLVVAFQATRGNEIYAELYRRYFDKVKAYCLKSFGNIGIAEDVAQDVLLKAYEKLPTLKDPQLWVAWLFTIARNEVLNAHKSRTLGRMEPLDSCSSLVDEPTDLEALQEKERRLSALPWLLSDPDVRILRLKYVEGRSIGELCRDLGIEESAVKMRLLRARRRVVKLYEQRYARA